jgi:pilus assembly protein FimV
MELHGTASTLDIDISGMPHTATDVDLGEEREPSTTDATGLDFILDDESRPAAGDSQVAPTIETPRVRGATSIGSDTQELTVDNLGLDVDTLRELEALGAEDTIESPTSRPVVEDTVETATAKQGRGDGLLDDEEQDLLSSTSLLDSTALMEQEEGIVDLTEATGEMPLLDSDTSATSMTRRIDFDLGGEPPTMSEVGTKLDLARAYMDMGDPEGARSILDEVLQEGNAVQRQEAERLITSLP